MLTQPKKMKHRKMQKGRSRRRLVETRGTTISYGKFALQAQGASWITGNQLEAVRKSIANSLKREGRTWIRVFPDKPITKLPPEVTLGGGKGNVDHYVAIVKPGRILFEIDGVTKERAVEALKKAAYKLPIRTKVIVK